MTPQEEAMSILKRREAYLNGLHVVYASGTHGEEYINKDAVLPYVRDTSRLCELGAAQVMAADLRPQVVVVPVVGAVALGQWHAYHLSNRLQQDVLAVYADRVGEEVALRGDRDVLIRLGKTVIGTDGLERITAIAELQAYIEAMETRPPHVDTFVLKRGYDNHVRGKRVLIGEDVINTGGSVSQTIQAVRDCGGMVVGVWGLVNRGGRTDKDLDVPWLKALVNVQMDAWPEDEMPDWLKARPVATHVGKGAQWLARQAGRTQS